MSEQLATTNDKPRDLRDMLRSDGVRNQIALALPSTMTPERMMRVALTTVNRTPKLLECSQASVLTALMSCAAMGIEPDQRNAHLIPYGKECQLIVDWKGLVLLAKRGGLKGIAADVVCENDAFEWTRNSDGLHFVHRVDYAKPRGQVYAAYCIWREDGGLDGECLQRDEIEAVRKRSRAGNAGPWVTDWAEMAKKTAIRRASKRWDISPEFAAAVALDDDRLAVTVERDITPKPQFVAIEESKAEGGAE